MERITVQKSSQAKLSLDSKEKLIKLSETQLDLLNAPGKWEKFLNLRMSAFWKHVAEKSRLCSIPKE